MQDRSRLKLDAQAGGAQARLERERQRLARALGFAEELGAALRREFAGLWTAPPTDPREGKLRAAVEAIAATCASGRGFLAAQEQAGLAEALAALQTYDLGPVLAATQGLTGLAESLRLRPLSPANSAFSAAPEATKPEVPPHPSSLQGGPKEPRLGAPFPPVRGEEIVPARPRVTGPLPPRPGTGPLPGIAPDRAAIRGIAPPPAVRAVPRAVVAPRDDHWAGGGHAPMPTARTPRLPAANPQPPVATPPPPPGPRPPVTPTPAAPTAKAPARQQFDAAFQLAREILGYVSGRLALVQVSLSATGLPGPRAPWHHVGPALVPGADRAGIDAPLRPWLPLLAQLFYTDAAAAREAITALEQWRQSQALARDAEVLRARLPALPAEAQAQLLAIFEAGKLRASVYPLGHLHLRFKAFPHLSTIFPGPPPSSPR